MDKIAKALAARDDAYAEVAHVLFGDGADELISKLSEAEKKAKNERTQARVGLATNVIGIGAGAAATPPAFKAAGEARRKAKGMPAKEAKAPGKVANSKAVRAGKKLTAKPKVAYGLAAGAAGLQVANLGGDFVANRVLARSAKKPEVKKSMPDQADLNTGGGAKLKYKLIARAGDKTKPVVEEKGKIVATKAKGKSLKVKEKITATVKKNTDITWEGEFSKVDSDRRQVFGYASVVEMNGEPVVDRQGDYISIDEIEKAAYNYVVKSRKGGDMHRREGDLPYHGSDMIESFLITDEKIEKMGLPPETPRGWWVGFQVNDEDLWAKVKSGERTGFSVHGKGQRISKEL